VDVAQIYLTLHSQAGGKIPNGQTLWFSLCVVVVVVVVAPLYSVLLCVAIFRNINNPVLQVLPVPLILKILLN
jgi:Flp pilus assembly protein TadB